MNSVPIRVLLAIFIQGGIASSLFAQPPPCDVPLPPMKPVQIAPELSKEIAEALPPDTAEQMRASFNAIKIAFEKEQRSIIERENARIRKSQEITEKSGGYIAAMKKELERGSSALALAPENMREIASRKIESRMEQVHDILSRAVCQKPEIFGFDNSVYQSPGIFTFESGPSIRNGTPMVWPLLNMRIYGCHLGNQIGSAQLTLTTQTGSIPLLVDQVHWHDDFIDVTVPRFDGKVDQLAQIDVAVSNGTVIGTLPVYFVQRRVLEIIDPLAHPGTIYFEERNEADENSFGMLVINDQLYYGVQGYHATSVWSPNTHSGVDRMFVDVRNGWTTYRIDPFSFQNGVRGFSPEPVIVVDLLPDNWAWSVWKPAKGTATCSPYPRPALRPGPQEIGIWWWCDRWGGKVLYRTNIVIKGPAGVPYW